MGEALAVSFSLVIRSKRGRHPRFPKTIRRRESARVEELRVTLSGIPLVVRQ